MESLAEAGIRFASVLLHTGVSSLEIEGETVESEAMYPEPFSVSRETAELVNRTHAAGGRVIAVGTTVVRALETAANADGKVTESNGWTSLVVSPDRALRAVDGLLTGWHEPESSHLQLLETVAGPELLDLSYRAAHARGYLWHEFGDVHLILP